MQFIHIPLCQDVKTIFYSGVSSASFSFFENLLSCLLKKRVILNKFACFLEKYIAYQIRYDFRNPKEEKHFIVHATDFLSISSSMFFLFGFSVFIKETNYFEREDSRSAVLFIP